MKVSIIGASGNVGSTSAFLLAEKGYVDDLVLISREQSIKKIKGESLDIYDAMAAMGSDLSIKTSSDIEIIQDSDVIVLTAGISRNPNILRMELAEKNAGIVAKYAKDISKYSPESVVLVVTNPVDVMTYVALKTSDLSKNKVFGLGNHLDSLRLRNYIAKHFKVHINEIHTRVIGQHGVYMVPLMSLTSIGGIPISDFVKYCYFQDDQDFDIEKNIKKVISAGNEIIGSKGATEYGPAYAISDVVKTILKDEKKIFSVSTYLNGEIDGVKDVCLGMPAMIGKEGIEKIIPIRMDDDEKKGFTKAFNFVKENTEDIMRSFNEKPD
ncbi:malate dehydrogenase [Methanobacterium spitsbergense]|uniref:Malate dehydrogenase n=1 Tax=Methanobacterium spitsbergense TaxID=2874285 RepID=A0A8T5URS0_9EURY|nr:malate dehydrogenase [Methanobacterium spitsbergense]MBZ2166384.1 malate dehydrogenase [Methanobacterium spitsbergense]